MGLPTLRTLHSHDDDSPGVMIFLIPRVPLKTTDYLTAGTSAPSGKLDNSMIDSGMAIFFCSNINEKYSRALKPGVGS